MPFQLPPDVDISSPQIKLINEWNRGFQEMNVDVLGKHLHKDFRRSVYPRSLGLPQQNNEEWLKEVGGVMGFATGFNTTVHSIIEAKGKVVIHTTSEVLNSFGLDTIHESLFIVHFVTDEDGCLKIKVIEDFRDSKVFLELSKSMGAAIAAAHTNK